MPIYQVDVTQEVRTTYFIAADNADDAAEDAEGLFDLTEVTDAGEAEFDTYEINGAKLKPGTRYWSGGEDGEWKRVPESD